MPEKLEEMIMEMSMLTQTGEDNMFKIISVTLILMTFSCSVMACFITPPEQIVSPEELIARTSRIALVRSVEARLMEDGYVEYKFDLLYALKGFDDLESNSYAFSIIGVPPESMRAFNDYDSHTDDCFWQPNGGRSWHDTDCNIRPSFFVGGVYLVFLDQPYHRKSFELIRKLKGDRRDQWLSWVENHSALDFEPQ